MYDINVINTQMLSVFAGENIKLPYRFQPSVKLLLSYEEYKKFCRTLVRLSLPILSFDIDKYGNALKHNDDVLLTKLFYLDVSKAILSEIALSIQNRTECTTFGVTFDEGTEEDIAVEDIEQKLISKYDVELVKKALMYAKQEMGAAFRIKQLSKHNAIMFYQAVAMRCLSFEKNPTKYNINK